MLLDCFTCPYEVVQYGEHILNAQNKKMELFSGTKILHDLEFFSRTKRVVFSDRWTPWATKKTSLKITFSRNENLKLVF